MNSEETTKSAGGSAGDTPDGGSRPSPEPGSRPSVPSLDLVLGKPLAVLDSGFVRVIDYLGDDGAIVQAARLSYGRGTKRLHEDRGLIRYLMRHRHTTPFEMCELKLHVRAPMDVWRQWIRHRTASVNEGIFDSLFGRDRYCSTNETFGLAKASGWQSARERGCRECRRWICLNECGTSTSGPSPQSVQGTAISGGRP